MNVDPADGHDSQISRKSLHVDFSLGRAVQGIGHLRAELLQVQMIDAVADFFIASETNSDGPVVDLGMGRQVCRRFHNHCDAGFVVTAQERGAVGGDDRRAGERD